MNKNEQLVSDPHDLILSLVDVGSMDTLEVLTACVKEMSDAECKRVLNSLCLPGSCEVEDAVEPTEPEDISTEEVDTIESEEEVVEPEEDVEVEEESLESRKRKLDSRVRRLEAFLNRKEARCHRHKSENERHSCRHCRDEEFDDLDDLDDLDDYSELEVEEDEDEFDEACNRRLENRLKRLERTLRNRCERRHCR